MWGRGWVWLRPGPTMAADRQRKNKVMSATDHTPRLPPTFNRLAWSNPAAQSADQIALAAPPIVALLSLRGGGGRNRPAPCTTRLAISLLVTSPHPPADPI